MAALRELDPVAYVRFASVYRDFRDTADFHAVLRELAADTRDPLELGERFGSNRDDAVAEKKH
jgi:transcriptional repressor NrdR